MPYGWVWLRKVSKISMENKYEHDLIFNGIFNEVKFSWRTCISRSWNIHVQTIIFSALKFFTKKFSTSYRVEWANESTATTTIQWRKDVVRTNLRPLFTHPFVIKYNPLRLVPVCFPFSFLLFSYCCNVFWSLQAS